MQVIIGKRFDLNYKHCVSETNIIHSFMLTPTKICVFVKKKKKKIENNKIRLKQSVVEITNQFLNSYTKI